MEQGAKYSASTIAKWFLYYNNVQMDDEGADLISNLKLQKLLYYAQGCYLAIKDKPLFNEKIVAQDHGPVVENVYREYRNNGSNGIIYDQSYDGSIDLETEEILKQVYNVFGQYSAWGLRNKTHQEKPWKVTPRNSEIDRDVIKEYFKDTYVSE